MKNKKLNDAFEYVRAEFFPRWDKNKEFTIVYDGKLPTVARYEAGEKKIKVRDIPENKDMLLALIIHEITHCYTYGLGKKFRDVIMKKAEIAKSKGLNKIYDLLIMDYNNCLVPSNIGTKKYVYSRLYDILLGNPDYTYAEILTGLANELNRCPHEIEKKYKQFRKYFEKGKRDGKAERLLYEKYKKHP